MFKKIITMIFILFIFIINSGFTVIGHRGDPIDDPEETFQSFDDAFSKGANYVELDVQLSKDNVLVVSHDSNLKRITGTSLDIAQNNFDTIHKLKTINGENIHSLNEVFAHYQNNPNSKFLIETKKDKQGNPKNMEVILSNVINKYNIKNRVMFHSFSFSSIKKLAKIFPNSQRIFISGSLKRLNFNIFQYSTGVNISSDLLTNKLVSQLHGLGQKVYVWDEMNENPDHWNWLINMNVDGVVTNYPSIGHKFQNIKSRSKEKSVDQDMIEINPRNARIFENPYTEKVTSNTVEFLTEFKVTKEIISDNEKFLQIGNNKFVKSINFTNSKNYKFLIPYFESTIQLNTKLPHNIYESKLTNYSIKENKDYKVLNIHQFGNNIFFKTSDGWINSKYILIKFTNDFSKKQYLSLPTDKRIPNIDLSHLN